MMFEIRKHVVAILEPIERRLLTFHNVTEEWCYTSLRFHLADLARIARCIGLPASFSLDNNAGQEALMITLYKFAKPHDFYDLEKVFGCESSRLSRIVKYVTLHVYNNH